MRRGRTRTGLVAPSVVALALAALLPAGAHAATNAVNGGTIRVSANYHPVGGNATEQAALASTHDLIVMGTGWGNNGPPDQYYATNPAIVAIEYQSWFDAGPGAPDYNYISQNHEDWFYHDANGYRVAVYSTHQNPDCVPAQCPGSTTLCNCRFGLNLGNPALRDYVATRFADLVTAGGDWARARGFDGIFMDNTFPNWPYRPQKVQSGSVSAQPVYPGGQTQTEDLWIADQKGFLSAVKNAVGAAKTIVFNGCFASSSTPTWQKYSYEFLAIADGCTMEDWVVAGVGTAATPKTGTSWQQDVDLFKGVTDRGKWSNALMGAGVHTAGVNRYAIATALLIWNGPHSTMNFWKGTAEEALAGRFAKTFPEAAVDLGTPQETYTKLAGGVASRKFSQGRVLVNPTATTQTVDLGETLQTIEGASVTSVTLASGRGEILIRPGGGNTPPPDVQNLKRSDTK